MVGCSRAPFGTIGSRAPRRSRRRMGVMPARRTARFTVVLALVAASFGASGSVAAAPNISRYAYRTPCPLPFPTSNVWNKPVDTLPVRSDSATLIATMGVSRYGQPDFGTFAGYGIPYSLVSTATPRSTVTFQWPSESDRVGYPIPASPKIEGAGAGGDRHLLMLDKSACRLWELYAAAFTGGHWTAGSGATWDLRSNALRTDGWTSADAAGLPIYPGLARYEDVAAGVIAHALRFTAPETRKAHIYPARHHASSLTGASYPPMGLRLRLKASVDISGFGPQSKIILRALKRYGMILADNGSAYYITGAPNPNWDDDDLHDLHQVTGAMFEVVATTGFVNGP